MRPRNNLIAALSVCLTLMFVPQFAQAKKHAVRAPAATESASIELPPGDDVFPDRRNAEAADRNCLSCHSTETVLNQPAMTREMWAAEIDRMRTAFKAQISAEDEGDVLSYLTETNGVRRDKWR